MDDLLAEFLAETLENTGSVRASEARGLSDEALAAEVYRMAATIGASARFLDISRLKCVAAAAETLAGGVRDGRLKGGVEVERLLLAAVGRIEEIATGMRHDANGSADDAELVNRLEIAAMGATSNPQINALDSCLRPHSGSESTAESRPKLRVIQGSLGGGRSR